MEAITSFLKDFDLGGMLPSMDSFLGRMTLFCWLFITVAPLLMLLFGLKFHFKPAKTPKGIGFRTYFVTGTNESWQYAQRLAGMLWMIAGGAMLLVSLVLGLFFSAMGLMSVVWITLIYSLIQLVVVVAAYLIVIMRTLKVFDKNGNRK